MKNNLSTILQLNYAILRARSLCLNEWHPKQSFFLVSRNYGANDTRIFTGNNSLPKELERLFISVSISTPNTANVP